MNNKRKNPIDFDFNMPTPWEAEEEREANKLIELQEEYLKRERKTQQEEKRIEKLTERKVSKKEERELEEKASEIKKLYSLDYWMRCFNKVSYENEISGQALFHVALGQALNTFKIYMEDDSELDWRLHYIWIQDSGSGKGKAMNFVDRVFTHPNFIKQDGFTEMGTGIQRKYLTHKLGRMNPASLLNTFKTDKKGKIEIDENGLEKVKQGIIESFDFIYSEEARTLLEGSRDSYELQEIFMTATETIGSTNNIYTKTLTDYEDTCKTRCTASFILTTRPFGRVKQTLVESGMIPRFLFYPRKLMFEDREVMNKKSSFSFRRADQKSNFSKDFKKLIDELNEVIEFANDNFIDFNPKDIEELLSFLYDKMMWFTKDVEDEIPSEENKYIMQTFVSRYKENMIIMAFHSAVMRFSKYVEKQDLQYAFDFLRQLYEAQKLWVSMSVEENKDETKFNLDFDSSVRAYLTSEKANDIEIELSDLVEYLVKRFAKPNTSIRWKLKKISKGKSPIIEIYKKDKEQFNKKYVKLV